MPSGVEQKLLQGFFYKAYLIKNSKQEGKLQAPCADSTDCQDLFYALARRIVCLNIAFVSLSRVSRSPFPICYWATRTAVAPFHVAFSAASHREAKRCNRQANEAAGL